MEMFSSVLPGYRYRESDENQNSSNAEQRYHFNENSETGIFTPNYIMGGQKFETTDPQKFLFGSISDLNYLGSFFCRLIFKYYHFRPLRTPWLRVLELAEAEPRGPQPPWLRSSCQCPDQCAQTLGASRKSSKAADKIIWRVSPALNK